MTKRILSSDFLTHLVFQTASIMIGILLALGVNEWRDERQNDQIVLKSIHNIIFEIEKNRTSLEEIIPYHQSCKLSIEPGENEETDPNDFLSVWKGLNPPKLYQSAYESAKVVKAMTLMDYELSNAISQLYAQQQFFYDMLHMYARVLISDLTMHPKKQPLSYASLVPVFNDLTVMEEELKTKYSSVLILLKKQE